MELIKRKDLGRIGTDKDGYKLNLDTPNGWIRILGILDVDRNVFRPLLFLVKKTNKIPKDDLNTFEKRVKNYKN